MYYNLNDNGGFLSPRSIIESYNMSVAKENDELKKQLEAYKNMRKEAINKLKEHKKDLDYEPWSIYEIKGSILFDLVDILNKVGGSDD